MRGTLFFSKNQVQGSDSQKKNLAHWPHVKKWSRSTIAPYFRSISPDIFSQGVEDPLTMLIERLPQGNAAHHAEQRARTDGEGRSRPRRGADEGCGCAATPRSLCQLCSSTPILQKSPGVHTVSLLFKTLPGEPCLATSNLCSYQPTSL